MVSRDRFVFCQKENAIFVKIWFLTQLGECYLNLGEIPAAFELSLQLDIDMELTGGNTYRDQYQGFLGLLCSYTGELDQAKEILMGLRQTATNRQTILSAITETAAILQTQSLKSRPG